jgi:hypothetical protein
MLRSGSPPGRGPLYPLRVYNFSGLGLAPFRFAIRKGLLDISLLLDRKDPERDRIHLEPSITECRALSKQWTDRTKLNGLF